MKCASYPWIICSGIIKDLRKKEYFILFFFFHLLLPPPYYRWGNRFTVDEPNHFSSPPDVSKENNKNLTPELSTFWGVSKYCSCVSVIRLFEVCPLKSLRTEMFLTWSCFVPWASEWTSPWSGGGQSHFWHQQVSSLEHGMLHSLGLIYSSLWSRNSVVTLFPKPFHRTLWPLMLFLCLQEQWRTVCPVG